MRHVRLCWIDIVTHDEHERSFALPVTIGRDAQNRLVLDSSAISGRHATIHAEQQRLLLADLNSRNGTYLNAQRIRQAEVQVNDVIQIGPYQLVVRPDISHVRLHLAWDDEQGQPQQAEHALPVTIGRDQQQAGIVLHSKRISRTHTRISLHKDRLLVQDLGSRNGTHVLGKRISQKAVANGTTIHVGPFAMRLTLTQADNQAASDSTILFREQQIDPDMGANHQQRQYQSWLPAFFRHQVVPIEEVYASGMPVTTVDYAAVGGGLGSFTWIDHLVIYGVQPRQIIAIGPGTDTEPYTLQKYGSHFSRCRPYGKYQRLCMNSQIPDHERLRSNSESCPDNIWGWPGYAAREIWHELRSGQIGRALRIFWQIFGEPVWTNTYTPRSSAVFRSLDREAQRIDWPTMFRYGYVRAIRKTSDGRYVLAYTRVDKQTKVRSLAVARYVHLAVGYPALRFLPHFNAYRNRTGDYASVINAYEAHDHVYRALERQPGIILLQGRGIVASRLIQRVWELRQRNPQITIFHLMRSPTPAGHRFAYAQRAVHNHIELQPFNWPRACWSGDLRMQLERASPEERKQLLTDWGGTTTADRQDWINIIEQGKREGWYQVLFGEIRDMHRTSEGRVRLSIEGKRPPQVTLQYDVDYVIDATGLEAKYEASPLLQDMVTCYNLPLNPAKRLHVENDFEIAGMRNQAGRMYASGIITLGGPYAAVDSFLGLQYAAQRTVDALAHHRAPDVIHLSGLAVFQQWLKWARGVRP